MKPVAAAAVACLLLDLSAASRAQSVTEAPSPFAGASLREITVSTPRGEVAPFNVPGSVDRVDGESMRDGRLGVNLSESLGGVPGLQVQNRLNYAQDLQLSIRGFGARSTFGVRGVRLYVDGIPATLPDGQGQTSNIDIGSLDRVEILRGPFSALYGNSSGGVLQAFTASGEGRPKLAYSAAGGSNGTWRQSLQASGSQGAVDYLLGASRFQTDGWREHSAARPASSASRSTTATGSRWSSTACASMRRTRWASRPTSTRWRRASRRWPCSTTPARPSSRPRPACSTSAA